MLQSLEDHIRSQGLADMVENAENVTSVGFCRMDVWHGFDEI